MKTAFSLAILLFGADVTPQDTAYIRCRATSRPAMTSPAARSLKCGERITVLGKDDTGMWTQIRTADNLVGYVSSAYVSDTKPGATPPIPESLKPKGPSVPRIVSRSLPPENPATRAPVPGPPASPPAVTPPAGAPPLPVRAANVQVPQPAIPSPVPHPQPEPRRPQRFTPVQLAGINYPLEIKILQTEAIPWSQPIFGPSVNTNCSVVNHGTTYGRASVWGDHINWTTRSYDHLSLSCRTDYSPGVNWPHLLITMLVVASDGNAYVVSCNRSVPWSKCNSLQAGRLFPARWTNKGLTVGYTNNKGRQQETTYSIDSSKSLR